MLRFLIAISILCVVNNDSWSPYTINGRHYIIKNEGKVFKPLYLENEESITADLTIDGDTSRMIKVAFCYPFNKGDTTIIRVFDNDVSFGHTFDIVILNNKHTVRYNRELDDGLIQKFISIKSVLELSSSDFSEGSNIRGHVDYVGKCISGCIDKNKRVKIEGNFAVTIGHFSPRN